MPSKTKEINPYAEVADSIAAGRTVSVEFANAQTLKADLPNQTSALIEVKVLPVESMLAAEAKVATEAEVKTKKLSPTPTTTPQQSPSRQSSDGTIVDDVEVSNASSTAAAPSSSAKKVPAVLVCKKPKELPKKKAAKVSAVDSLIRASPVALPPKAAAKVAIKSFTFGHSPKAVRQSKAETAKAPKAKKAAAPKASSPMKTATATPEAKSPGAKLAAGGSGSHPPYLEMIVAAVESLKEHNGSSRQAILQYITSTYELGVDSKMAKLKLKEALRRGVKTGILKKTKVRNCLLFSFSCVSY